VSSKPLITDEEYAREVKVHSDYLNWVFGLSTIFLSVACLQFNTPWKAAVVCLVAIVPMYAYAFRSFPVSLKVLRRLYAETKDVALKSELQRLERKYHGWRVLFTNGILWLALLLYLSILFAWFPATWVKT